MPKVERYLGGIYLFLLLVESHCKIVQNLIAPIYDILKHSNPMKSGTLLSGCDAFSVGHFSWTFLLFLNALNTRIVMCKVKPKYQIWQNMIWATFACSANTTSVVCEFQTTLTCASSSAPTAAVSWSLYCVPALGLWTTASHRMACWRRMRLSLSSWGWTTG